MSLRGGGQTPYLQWACCSPRPGSPRLAQGRVQAWEGCPGERVFSRGFRQASGRFWAFLLTQARRFPASSPQSAQTQLQPRLPLSIALPLRAPGEGKNLGYQAQSLQ